MIAQSFGIAFIILWIIMVLGGIVAAIVFLAAAWKLMKAHESVAASMNEIAKSLQEHTSL